MVSLNECLGRRQPFVKTLPTPIVGQRAPVTTDTDYPKGMSWIDESVSPPVIYTHLGGGDWDTGGNQPASTTTAGIVLLDEDGTLSGADNSTVPTSLAVKTYADNLAIAGSPNASETVKGIAELTTTAEATAGTDDERIMTALKVAQVLASPAAIGSSTPAAGSFTTLAATGAVDFDSGGSWESGGTAIDIGDDADTAAINVGTGAAARTITIGNATGATQVDIESGTGPINVGTNAVAHTVTIGNTTGATAVVVNVGTGDYVLDGVGASTYTIGAATTTGTIDIGGTSQTGTGTLFGGDGAQTVNVANSTGGKTVNIAAGAGANAVTIGSTNTTSATTINSGSGGVTLTGDVDVSTGNLQITGAAKGLQIETGAATDMAGNSTLSSGTVTINNTNIATGDYIFIQRIDDNSSTALGMLTYTISNGASFTVTSLQQGTPGSTQTNDNSTFAYFIVRPL